MEFADFKIWFKSNFDYLKFALAEDSKDIQQTKIDNIQRDRYANFKNWFSLFGTKTLILILLPVALYIVLKRK